MGANRRPYKAGTGVVVVVGARVVVAAPGPVSGEGGVTVAGGGVGFKGGRGSALPDRAVQNTSCWRATVGCKSVQAMPTSSRCGAAVARGYRPMLARWRLTSAIVLAMITSMENFEDEMGFLGPEEALGAAACEGGRGLPSRCLSIRGGRGSASLSVGSTA